jgi:DNA-binding transcriptional regulator LsrR (DeoR family)
MGTKLDDGSTELDEAQAVVAEIVAAWQLAESQRRFALSKARTAVHREDVTAEDIADALGVSRSTLFRMLRDLDA